jgi:hypothetical protein
VFVYLNTLYYFGDFGWVGGYDKVLTTVVGWKDMHEKKMEINV